MTDIKAKFGTSNQSITLTLTSLSANAFRQSAVVDNSSNLFLDAFVQLKTKVGTGPAAPNILNVYAYASADGGTTYSDGCSGSDASLTPTSPPNLKLIGTVNVPTASTAYKSDLMSVAAAFGGRLPEKWGIVIENKSGTTLSATGGDHAVWYEGVLAQN